jgi:predicted esterase
MVLATRRPTPNPSEGVQLTCQTKSGAKIMNLRIGALTVLCPFVGLINLVGEARGEILQKVGTFGAKNVDYFVVLPDGFDPDREYPAVIAFAGGSQSLEGTRRALDNHWVSEAEKRGYIIVSPSAPEGQLFFQAGASIFPSFLDQILRDYKVEQNKFHIAGRSNGGLSAFHVAASYPQYFRSVTGFPGYLQPPTAARVAAIGELCIYMHVGEFDSGWRRSMSQQAQMFRDQGFPTQFAIEAGMSHGLDSLAGIGSKRLFENLEDAVANCG